jgi:RimJ/RimL family protein N-acetyltransferase
MKNIRLEPIDHSNWRSALGIRTEPKQLEFVSDFEPVALVILSKCYVQPRGLVWKPFGIISGETMIGIVALAYTETTCELLHLVIDKSVQDQGLGTIALEVIVDHVKCSLPNCVEITLTVHPRNEHAQRLYTKAGFQNTGACRYGEQKWRLNVCD